MRFTGILAATAFGAFATASEEAHVRDFSLRTNNGLQSISFKLQPANLQCTSSSAAELAGTSFITCDTSKYRFSINGTKPEYQLTIIKEVAVAAGIQGSIKFQPQCHAGGDGVNDYVCYLANDIDLILA
ncbi:Major allergen Alt [Neofusicoccum parvum]|uniref:Major allergen Alt n=1 Tax=Neofusicoccum parvum TaxID=310453 RepID=A0ACB5SB70_9PEZI|nr:Major allergen Alt [Neofusicoccum parvum]GME65729.1 Major allergen Alt [Neofusicoccum parvum]